VNLWQSLRAGDQPSQQRSMTTIDDYIAAVNEFSLNGVGYSGGVRQTLTNGSTERLGTDYAGLIQSGYAANGVVFACMLARQLVFSAIRFQYQRIAAGRPSELFGDRSLGLLEQPWAGGTTQDLLSRMVQDADLAGNSYWTNVFTGELVRLRPDWVDVALAPRYWQGGIVGYKRIGYVYTEGGYASGHEPVPLHLDEVAHFAPLPDPLASYRGMSWLTPIVREVQADSLMGQHKRKFFENGATPNMIVKHPTGSADAVKKFQEMLEAGHAGVDNAYRTLHIGGGADATVVGSSLQQIDFAVVQGHGETRIAAAAGVPPVIVGLSEGLAAATYSNYAQARRRFADGTMHPLWQNAAGSLGLLFPTPPGVRLWYDASNVPFLREDEKDAAEIQAMEAGTMRQLTDAGYTPDSVLRAVTSGDWGLLAHSGLFSVQLQAPGSQPSPQPASTSGAAT